MRPTNSVKSKSMVVNFMQRTFKKIAWLRKKTEEINFRTCRMCRFGVIYKTSMTRRPAHAGNNSNFEVNHERINGKKRH